MSSSPDALFSSGSSNESILESIGSGIVDSHESPASVATGTGTGVTEPAVQTESGAGDGAGEVLPEWFEEAPEQFKAILSHQNLSAEHKKFLQDTYGELHGFKTSPIGQPDALSEVSTLFPGGIEDMRTAATDAQSFRTEMEQFNSGDPEQQTELLAGLLQSNPDAFVALLHSGSALLNQTLRDDYTAFATGMTKDHLDSISDGRFQSFFDSLTQKANEYSQLLETNPDAAAKLASRLAGSALQMADWWGSAKAKLGYDGQQQTPSTGRAPAPVNRSADQNSPEITNAKTQAAMFMTNFQLRHDAAVNPLISSALTRDLSARKMELPGTWQQKVTAHVAAKVKDALANDPQFKALSDRVYTRNSPNDPRKWDRSDQVMRTLMGHVTPKAQRLVEKFMRETLNELATLRGQQPARAAAAGTSMRSSSTGPSSTAGASGGKGNIEDAIKSGKSNADALQIALGIS